MGLQNQLSDVSSESFPILVVILIANCVGYLRSLTFTLFQSVGFSSPRFDTDRIDYSLCDAFGSGLGSLVVLAEQLNLNRLFSYTFDDDETRGGDDSAGSGSGSGSECVVCLNRLCDGERVRKLDCRHVFHKECFDGWLDTLNFKCPICRSSLVSDERVDFARRRVATDVFAWFTMT